VRGHKQWLCLTVFECFSRRIHYTCAERSRRPDSPGAGAGAGMSSLYLADRKHIPGLLAEGRLSMETLDQAVRRVLASKARMGLLDDPYRSLDLGRVRRSTGTGGDNATGKI
jgi:beta-glucosidase-like glycosyl hydrolase